MIGGELPLYAPPRTSRRNALTEAKGHKRTNWRNGQKVGYGQNGRRSVTHLRALKCKNNPHHAVRNKHTKVNDSCVFSGKLKN